MLAVRSKEEQLSLLTTNYKFAPAAERMLVSAILFYGAYFLMLPVSSYQTIVYPWWAQRIAVGNIIIFELLFIVWIAIFGWRYIERSLLNGGGYIRASALLLIALAVWCGVISLLRSPLPMHDAGRTLRLLVLACMLLATLRWTRKMGEFTLAVLVFGFLAGTAVNLLMTFQYQNIVHGVLRLSGQSTPGVAAAIAIHLAAWLFLFSRNRTLQVISLITTVVCGLACAISFSRTGWIIGALGAVAWAYILFFPQNLRNLRSWDLRNAPKFWMSLAVVAAMAGTLVFASQVAGLANWIGALVMEKEWFGGQSNDYRMAYFTGTAEIVLHHPFGVGYSGFLDAMQATDVYQSGIAARESDYDANPHSSFLYYISAGGIPAALMVLALFASLLNVLRLGLEGMFERSGRFLFVLIAISYLVIALTVPYIFNSIILLVPAAVAAGLRPGLSIRHATIWRGAAASS